MVAASSAKAAFVEIVIVPPRLQIFVLFSYSFALSDAGNAYSPADVLPYACRADALFFWRGQKFNLMCRRNANYFSGIADIVDANEQVPEFCGGRNPENALHRLFRLVENAVRHVARQADEVASL